MSDQKGTNLKAVTLDFGVGDFTDHTCVAGTNVCSLATRAGSDVDSFTFDFTQPKVSGDGATLAAVGHDHFELVQPDGTNGDSWISISGRSDFIDLTPTGASFTVTEAGMSSESVAGNGATGTFLLSMTCRGVPITGL
jgi:hypothetical protein